MSKIGKLQIEQKLISRLKEDCQNSFSILFDTYYKDLVLFAGSMIRDKSVCEDIVQTIFMKLWNDRNTLNIETSLKSYLMRAVYNSCIDEIRHQKIINILYGRLLSNY